jgi:quinol monooxygenase YgiN
LWQENPVSQPLTIVAIFQAAPDQIEALATALQGLVAPTLTEEGCLNYDLHQDLETSGRFLFYENWRTRADWDAHMESAHLIHHKANHGDLFSEVQILQMEKTS